MTLVFDVLLDRLWPRFSNCRFESLDRYSPLALRIGSVVGFREVRNGEQLVRTFLFDGPSLPSKAVTRFSPSRLLLITFRRFWRSSSFCSTPMRSKLMSLRCRADAYIVSTWQRPSVSMNSESSCK